MEILKIKNSIFKAFIEVFIPNKKKRSKVKAWWTKKHLQQYVDGAIKTFKVLPAKTSDEKNHLAILASRY